MIKKHFIHKGRKKVDFTDWKLVHLEVIIRQLSLNLCKHYVHCTQFFYVSLLTPSVHTGYIRLLLHLYSMLVSHLHIQMKRAVERDGWKRHKQFLFSFCPTSVLNFSGIVTDISIIYVEETTKTLTSENEAIVYSMKG